jgi:hypothetical protein
VTSISGLDQGRGGRRFCAVPLIATLFLAVLGYCCLEWLHDTLAPGESLPTRRIRTIGANP